MKNRTLLSFYNPKAAKGAAFGYLNGIHYMAPSTLGGVGNLCPKASAGCAAACLGFYSGRAAFVSDLDNEINDTRQARIERAREFMTDRRGYMRNLVRYVVRAERLAKRKRKKLCVRLNGSTDIAFEGIAVERNGQTFKNMFEAFPAVQFVDYTKIAGRFNRAQPANYHLTFSRSESNEAEAIDLLNRGFNVAAVFTRKPAMWCGFKCLDGDNHDLRHLDKRAKKGCAGYVIALSPKGPKAKRDQSGFVIQC